MWMFTKLGFYSVVCALKAPEFKAIDLERVCVRARSRKHLENLIEKYLFGAKIEETSNRDYRYRILIEKDLWSVIAKLLSTDIDYDNFKDSVGETEDVLYESALHDVWDHMYQFQQDIMIQEREEASEVE